jgi:hypothetical protein
VLGSSLWFSFFKLETDFSVASAHQISRKLAARASGDKIPQQVGSPGAEQLLHLFGFDSLLQNDGSRTEVAGLRGSLRLFANVGHAVCKHTRTTFRARAERFTLGEVHNLDGAVITGGTLAKVKLRYVFGVELDDRIERAPHLVAETAQRADLAPGEQFLNFGGLKLAAGDDFPQRKVTGLALEFLVRLLD